MEAPSRHDGRQLEEALVACCDSLPVEDVGGREGEGFREARGDEVPEETALLAPQN
jgi:hypothetical protein